MSFYEQYKALKWHLDRDRFWIQCIHGIHHEPRHERQAAIRTFYSGESTYILNCGVMRANACTAVNDVGTQGECAVKMSNPKLWPVVVAYIYAIHDPFCGTCKWIRHQSEKQKQTKLLFNPYHFSSVGLQCGVLRYYEFHLSAFQFTN